MRANDTWQTAATSCRWLVICLLLCLLWAPLAILSWTLGGLGHGARLAAGKVMNLIEDVKP